VGFFRLPVSLLHSARSVSLLYDVSFSIIIFACFRLNAEKNQAENTVTRRAQRQFLKFCAKEGTKGTNSTAGRTAEKNDGGSVGANLMQQCNLSECKTAGARARVASTLRVNAAPRRAAGHQPAID
jgi:hypothetical protein